METTKQRTARLMSMSAAQLVMHCQDITAERDELYAVLSYWMTFIDSEEDDERQAPWVEKARQALKKKV